MPGEILPEHQSISEFSVELSDICLKFKERIMAYLPLQYVDRFESLADYYCSKMDCSTDILLDLIGDEGWVYDEYTGNYQQKYECINNGKHFAPEYMLAMRASISAAALTKIWSFHKEVYEPDPDFSKALVDTETLRVMPRLMEHLPFNTFYIDFSKSDLFVYSGFFVNVKILDDKSIRIISLPVDDCYGTPSLEEAVDLEVLEVCPDEIPDVFWIKSTKFADENGSAFFDYDSYRDALQTDRYENTFFRGSLTTYRTFILQLLTFLSSKEPDVNQNEYSIKTYHPSSQIKNKYREIRKWDVGARYGETIRKYDQKRNVGISNGSNIYKRASKRPHVRCAHWGIYHIGKGRKEITVKWILPIFVNGKSYDVIPTTHRITDKDPQLPSGEERIKEYLESEHVIYKTQQYIRSINKRYDFSIQYNGNLLFVEFDGEQHFKTVDIFGGISAYKKQIETDKQKNKYCRDNNIPLLRIRYDQACFIPDMIKNLQDHPDEYIQKNNTYLSNEDYYSICEEC